MTSAISSSSLAAQFAQSIFKKADADNDGQLTEAELEAAKPKDAPAGAPTAADLIKTGDKDGDGKLTQAELEGALKANQSKLADPVQSLLLALQEQEGEDAQGDGGLLDALLKALDDNKDGKIDQTDIDALKKKAQAANNNSTTTDGGSESYSLTIAATAQNTTGVGSNSYANQTASLSILLKFQEAA